jgi:hypothetical protein
MVGQTQVSRASSCQGSLQDARPRSTGETPSALSVSRVSVMVGDASLR